MGGSNSSLQETTSRVVSESLTESMMSVSNSKTTRVSASQVMNIECNPSDAVQAAYLQGYIACLAHPGRDCETSRFACVIEDLKQDSVLEYQGMSSIDSALVSQVQDKMTADLEAKLKSEKDGLAEWAKTALNVGGSGSDTSRNRSEVEHRVKSVVNSELVSTVDSLFTRNQTINLKSSGGLVVKRLTQSAATKLVESVLNKSSAFTSMVSELDAKTKLTTEVKSKGLVDMFESLMGFFTSASQGTALVIIVVVVALVIGATLMFRSKNAGLAISAYAKSKGG